MEESGDHELAGANPLTPTQRLRDKLVAFRFSDDLSPSARRSPRTGARYATVEVENNVLPTLPSVGPSRSAGSRKRSQNSEVDSTESPEASPKKRRSTSPKKTRKKVEVAPLDKYAHLRLLNDHLGDRPDMLDVMFCGINPGQLSATIGHHFAHQTNHFWRCLHGSHLTDRLLSPTEDHTLPDDYRLGLTNLVDRPSAQAAELAHSEYTAGVPALLRKIVQKRPRVVCFVGKAIWDGFIRAAAPRSQSSSGSRIPVTYDIQPYKVVHAESDSECDDVVRETLFFVTVSTSGLVTGYQLPQKIKQFTLLKQRVDELKSGTLDTSCMTVISHRTTLRCVDDAILILKQGGDYSTSRQLRVAWPRKGHFY